MVAPSIWRFATVPAEISGSSDYLTHIDFATRTGLFPLRLLTPQPIFHAVVSALSPIMGASAATTLLVSAASGLLVAVVAGLAARPFAGRGGLYPTVAVACGLGVLLMESPSVLAGVRA